MFKEIHHKRKSELKTVFYILATIVSGVNLARILGRRTGGSRRLGGGGRGGMWGGYILPHREGV